jgi:hypothetical protein
VAPAVSSLPRSESGEARWRKEVAGAGGISGGEWMETMHLA